ncbi:MAG: PAS domain S-box protein, partial [Verrucomicrobiota bacterium]
MKPAPEKSPAAILRAKAEAQVKKTDAARPPQSEVEVRQLQHELEVHQIELEMQNEGLRAAQVETALALEQFTELYDFAPAGYFTLTADGTIRQLNLTGAQFLGAARSHLIGASFRLLVAEGDRKTFNHFLAQVFGSPEIQQLRLPLQPKNGAPLIARLEARRDAAGTRCRLVMIDVTARVQAEEQLREQEERYHTLADSGRALIWTAGTDKKRNYFNQPWLKFTGRTQEQELGDGWAEGVHPDDRARCFKIFAEAFDRRESFSMDYRLRHHTGEFRWIQDVGTPRHDRHGNFLGYIGHCIDITERRQAEFILREQERQYRELFEFASDALLLLDESGRVLDANQMAMQFYGYERDEFLTKKNVDLSAEPEETGRRTLEAVTKSDQVFFIPHRLHRRKNGTVFSVEITCRTLIRNGRTVLLVACR